VDADIDYHIIDLNGSPSAVMRYGGEITQATVLDVADNRIASIRNMLHPEKLRYLAESLGSGVAHVDPRLLEPGRTGP